MIQHHSSTGQQRAQWVSILIAQQGRYGSVSQLAEQIEVSRQTLYTWKAKGEKALQAAFGPQEREGSRSVERAVLTLLVEGHASYRGIQACLAELLGVQVSLGTITAIVQQAGERAQACLAKLAPAGERGLALDELYSSQRGQAYLSVVDVQSGAVWATTSPVAVDGESWTLLLWQLQEQDLHWHTTVSDGGKAIGEAVQAVTPQQGRQRDVWHVLHECQKVQGRAERLVQRLQEQAQTVARQAERLAAGKKLRGAHPVSDVAAHASRLRQAQYVASGLRYLSGELQRLLEGVVLAPAAGDGILCREQRCQELEALLALWDELCEQAPTGLQRDLKALYHHVQLALPYLLTFAPALEPVQQLALEQLGPEAVALIAWAWQRRAILGPRREQLLADLPHEWQLLAEPLRRAWDEAVRASSVVENWHSLLRPYLAVHRTLSTGMLALLALWHNYRMAPRGLYQGQSPLSRSGFAQAKTDWLVVLGYPPLSRLCQQEHEEQKCLVA